MQLAIANCNLFPKTFSGSNIMLLPEIVNLCCRSQLLNPKLLYSLPESKIQKWRPMNFLNKSFLPAQLSISQKNVILMRLPHQLWTPFPCYTTFRPKTAGNLRVEPFRREPHLPERCNFEVDERDASSLFVTKSPSSSADVSASGCESGCLWSRSERGSCS